MYSAISWSRDYVTYLLLLVISMALFSWGFPMKEKNREKERKGNRKIRMAIAHILASMSRK